LNNARIACGASPSIFSSTITLSQFAPSFFLLDSTHVDGIILRSNGSGAYGGGTYDILGPTGNSLGYATVAAKAGDTLELFGTGFGPTNPFSGGDRHVLAAAKAEEMRSPPFTAERLL
jgi:uncharacterized protein (TIGR03437 family)